MSGTAKVSTMSNALRPTIPPSSTDLPGREATASTADIAKATTRALLRQLYADADYCVLLLGPGGEIVWENAAATKQLALEFETLRGRLFGELLGLDPRRYENEMRLNRLLAGELPSLKHEAEWH